MNKFWERFWKKQNSAIVSKQVFLNEALQKRFDQDDYIRWTTSEKLKQIKESTYRHFHALTSVFVQQKYI